MDGAPLLPWIPGDAGPAAAVLSSFTGCLLHLHRSVPAARLAGRSVLVRAWTLYATRLAQPGVKEHVLAVVHPALARLPWSQMVPTELEVDLMVKVCSMFLPPCHAFLGSVFVQVRVRIIITATTISILQDYDVVTS